MTSKILYKSNNGDLIVFDNELLSDINTVSISSNLTTIQMASFVVCYEGIVDEKLLFTVVKNRNRMPDTNVLGSLYPGFGWAKNDYGKVVLTDKQEIFLWKLKHLSAK